MLRLRYSLIGVGTLALAGCFDTGEGLEPPLDGFYFPAGMAMDRDGGHLFVVNSDFDLQFNAGTLQSLDLERVRALVPERCRGDEDCDGGQVCDASPSEQNDGRPSFWCIEPSAADPCQPLAEASQADRINVPGRCEPIDLLNPSDGRGSLFADVVKIGAFATEALYRARPAEAAPGPPGRLFIPVRGDTTLHWVDTQSDGTFDCGQSRNGGACDDEHRRGDDADEENTRDLELPDEPFAIDATRNGEAVVVTHQTEGAVSLFVNDWSGDVGPTLQFTATGLPSRPVGIAAVPQPALVAAAGIQHQPGFLVSFRNAAQVLLLRYFSDGFSGADSTSPARPFILPVAQTNIVANSVGDDSRGIAVHGDARRSAEERCLEAAGVDSSCATDPECAQSQPQFVECLREAAQVPLDVFVANRTPASLLVGRTRAEESLTFSDDLPAFHTSLPLSFGPSRVVTGQVINGSGELVPRVFVLCFDSRIIFVYDPVSRRIETEIRTGRGPQALVIDTEHGLGYVAHFTDSYLSVIGLDQRFAESYGQILASIGEPTAPRASK